MRWILAIRRSLKWKFIVLVLLLVIGLVCSIGYFSYYESSKTIRQDVGLFSDQILKQANLNLDQFFLDYEYGFLLFGLSYEFEQWLRADKDDLSEQLIMENRLETKFVLPFKSQYPDLLSVSLYNDNGVEKLFREDRNIFPDLDYSVKQESWFSEVRLTKRLQMFVHQPVLYKATGATQVLTMTKKFDYGNSSGFIKIDINPSRILQILSQIHLGRNSIALISGPDGGTLLQSGSERTTLDPTIWASVSASDSGSFYSKATNEMIMFQTLPYTGWKTIVIVPYENVAEGVYRVRDFTIIVAVINIIIAIGLIWMISSSLTSRLLRLKSWIKETQMGNLSKRISIGGIDEAAELGLAYNRMLDELEGSMNNLTESRLLQQQAVFSALQSQIHSHFLYNALESINSMANLDGNQGIMDTTVALSNMLRYTSNYQQELVTLQEEIQHAGDFIKIMNIMYGDRIELIYSLEDPMQRIYCLKAVIQPIIENSIKHGFERTGAPMKIQIRVELEETYATIMIHDSGEGFAPGKLEDIQSILGRPGTPTDYRTMQRVGLLNVHYRIRVYYKDADAGIRISNHPDDGGALVQIKFPIASASGKP
ncbi:sensor histidine kinase [Paenibacillus sp. PAMC21692]|uniref:cache domain-containing sensor histidine kinase n=1 Tax=Paenibacillus sp. PAMC21692 TaxID=2762320 RepID=UPI00164EC77C|nr:sensor histidine kinase [Paenibacillus sp. PAMC21692]QNK57917.1 histidine kinase [Paenibacillus sp. PAMC21692]